MTLALRHIVEQPRGLREQVCLLISFEGQGELPHPIGHLSLFK